MQDREQRRQFGADTRVVVKGHDPVGWQSGRTAGGCTLDARYPLKWLKTLLTLETVSVEQGLFCGVSFLFTRTKSQVQILYRPLSVEVRKSNRVKPLVLTSRRVGSEVSEA